jgi:eukaryotic-like serine/threonine-protein kinase
MTLATGTQLGPYEILSPLGAGGMGEIWRARDTRLDREVAIKVLPANYANDADRLKRFEQEAKAASALNHPNIITVYEIGQVDEVHFLMTELIDGHTLRSLMNDQQLTLPTKVDIAIQMAAGLTAAHEAGIIHRDIKPGFRRVVQSL